MTFLLIKNHLRTSLFQFRKFSISTQRLELLKKIYTKAQGLEKSSPEYQSLTNGQCFLEYFQPFKNRKNEHLQFLSQQTQFPKQYQGSYRLNPFIAAKLTEQSCALEGSTISTKDILEMIDLQRNEPLSAPGASNHKDNREVEEAYWHLVALYAGVSEFPNILGKFCPSIDQILSLHQKLMYFEPSVAGKLRSFPIQITGYELTVFPYPEELPSLLKMFCEWSEQASSSEIVHPVLFACDLFLNFAHLHPFHDGNGRISRLLMSIYLIGNGMKPVLLTNIDRPQYLEFVFQAQQCGNRVQFYHLIWKSLLNERD